MFDELSEEEFAEELRAAERGDVSAAAVGCRSQHPPDPSSQRPRRPPRPGGAAAYRRRRRHARDPGHEGARQGPDLHLTTDQGGLSNAAKESGVEAVSDEEAVKVLRKMSKMRQESIEMFEKGGEPAAAAEKAELDVIAQWLPALASEDTVRGWIQSLIDDGNTNPGKMMGLLMKDHKGQLDGSWRGELLATRWHVFSVHIHSSSRASSSFGPTRIRR